jgi:hypothetical protein
LSQPAYVLMILAGAGRAPAFGGSARGGRWDANCDSVTGSRFASCDSVARPVARPHTGRPLAAESPRLAAILMT